MMLPNVQIVSMLMLEAIQICLSCSTLLPQSFGADGLVFF
jgi:hypothetical protein